ncbi:glutamate-rich protein 4 isoform X2 [Camelus ferus]|uniref:Glutamate-rich protein 4 isoform X2 n=2 Tax=Camelus TaxID=9836 RepID=A0A8B8TI23_CAMFR|nr:glutamate-rich protein 4 isoform X2 [Camelus ferus]XP_045366858.1 glutamate-rich protein 4 isoform X2 [Camelus bactrianus]
MELWKQLRQAGLVPPGLGPPPRALNGFPPVEKGNLRRVDVQLLGQLCSLGLEMGALREELVTFLEEEEEESIEEEDRELEGKQEGASSPAPGRRLPDFEMTI